MHWPEPSIHIVPWHWQRPPVVTAFEDLQELHWFGLVFEQVRQEKWQPTQAPVFVFIE
jgi:hypothetical protein